MLQNLSNSETPETIMFPPRLQDVFDKVYNPRLRAMTGLYFTVIGLALCLVFACANIAIVNRGTKKERIFLLVTNFVSFSSWLINCSLPGLDGIHVCAAF